MNSRFLNGSRLHNRSISLNIFPLELYKTKFLVDRASHLLYHSEATFVSLGSYQEKFSSF